MRNVLSVLPPTFCVFFLVFNLCHISIANPTPRYIAVDNIAIDCGTSGNSTNMDGRMWIGDVGSKFSPVEENGKNSTNYKSKSNDPAVDSVPYMTARQSYLQFTYVLPVTPGPKFVRLYFYPRDYSSLDGHNDCFTIKAGSYTLFADFRASDTVNAFDTIQHKTLSKEFCVMVLENEKQLNLTFIPCPSTAKEQFYAFINGIEIVSMPYYLYYSRQEEYGIGIPYIGQTGERAYISTDMPLETVYRLNVGGNSIPPSSDTGMFREWSNIDVYYRLGEAVISREPFLKLNYSAIPNYTAPDDLY
ncbi:hypothetical protein F2P56_000021 [Juglans regia]|uniref:Malectin-like domain-containing protein n=1 Tax=Juglans regia TaxID=51240 RepID=A0A833Y724_JUGRE|nr:hypothetical protein F2P56_000021 [Juglans regia]